MGINNDPRRTHHDCRSCFRAVVAFGKHEGEQVVTKAQEKEIRKHRRALKNGERERRRAERALRMQRRERAKEYASEIVQ